MTWDVWQEVEYIITAAIFSSQKTLTGKPWELLRRNETLGSCLYVHIKNHKDNNIALISAAILTNPLCKQIVRASLSGSNQRFQKDYNADLQQNSKIMHNILRINIRPDISLSLKVFTKISNQDTRKLRGNYMTFCTRWDKFCHVNLFHNKS